jgi:integrase
MDRTNAEKRDAEKAAKAAEAGKWTITKLWEEYKKNKPDLKGMTTDQNRFEKHIEPTFGHKEPSELAPLDVDRLRLKLQKKLAIGTVKNVLELLRRIINFGVKKRLCNGAPFKIGLPRLNNIKTEDLSPNQLKKLIAAIDKDKNIQAANLMQMALFTGMRRGELFRLKWSDIDYDKGFIHIRGPKSGVDQKIPLNDTTRELLKSHPKHKKSPYVFAGRRGRKRTDIKHQVNRIKNNAGLPADFRALHGLRHVYASMLASSGKVDMYTLQKLLTHKSPQMTQRYAHLRDDALKKASDIAADIIGQAATADDKNNDKIVETMKK